MKTYSTIGKFYIILALVLGGAVVYFGYTALGGTSIATTLNPTGVGTTLDDGLVGHWTFDGPDMQWQTASSEVRDISGQGKHGAIMGGLNNRSVTEGVLGQALAFSGTQGVDIPYGNGEIMPISISLWARPDSETIGSDYVIIGSTNGTNQRFYLLKNRGDRWGIGIAGSTAVFDTGIPVEYDEWSHLVLTTDDVNASLYVNSEFSHAKAHSDILLASDFKIANQDVSGPNYWVGDIDDVSIYNRALSADEIRQLYRMGATTKVATTPEPKGPTVTLDDDLLVHWTFDGPDMFPNVRDRSGNANHGTLRNVSATTTGIGRLGQALRFDGIDDRVQGPTGAIKPVSSVSYGAWVYPERNDLNEETPLSWDSGSANPFRLRVDSTGAEAIICQITTSETDIVNALSNQTIESTWQHLFCVYDPGEELLTLYQDGVAIASTAASGTISYTGFGEQALLIGDDPDHDALLGLIDDVRVYERALSAEEVKQIYRMGATTKVATTPKPKGPAVSLDDGLVGHWTFDGPDMQWQTASSEVRDISGQGKHGAIMGGLNNRSVTEGVLGQALYFGGVNDVVQMPTVVVDPVADITFSAWWKLTALDGSGEHIVMVWDGGSANAYEMEVDNVGTEGIECTVDTVNNLRALARDTGPDLVEENKWYFQSCVYDSTAGTLTAYLDGVEIDQVTGLSGGLEYPTFGQGFLIGDDSGKEFEGVIDDVRVYERALSADEIAQLYRLGR